MAVEITPTQVGLEIPQITVEKTAVVDGMVKNLVYAGQEITYVVAVTNNGETTVENIEITDKIPENTTYVDESIEDAFVVKVVEGQFIRENIEEVSIEELTKQMKQAAKELDFERAAWLRDEIIKLENRLQSLENEQ